MAEGIGWSAFQDPWVRFSISFAALTFLGEATYHAVLPGSAPFEVYREMLAAVTGEILEAFGGEVAVQGTTLRRHYFAISVTRQCDAIRLCVLVAAAIGAAPLGWPTRLAGAALSVVWVQALNIITRIVTVFFAGEHSAFWFRTLHEVVWPVAIVIGMLAAWVFWVGRAGDTQRHAVTLRSKSILVFVVQVGLLVSVIASLPLRDAGYARLFHAQANVMFGWLGDLRVVRLAALEDSSSADTTMLGFERGRIGARWRASFQIRECGLWPMVVIGAMVLSTPLSWRRRLLALMAGLALLNAFTLTHLGVNTLVYFALADASESGNLGIWPRVESAASGCFDSMFLRYAVVLAMWALVTRPSRDLHKLGAWGCRSKAPVPLPIPCGPPSSRPELVSRRVRSGGNRIVRK
jgi:exosortase/archaeosortase family protein